MLADQLLASKVIQAVEGKVQSFSQHLKIAHRFELSSDFVVAAETLKRSRPSSFASAVPLCRPPFPTTWFELTVGDLRKFRAEVGPDQKPLSRLGILFKNMTGDAWVANLAWSFTDGSVNISPVAVAFYLGNDPELLASWGMVDTHDADLVRQMREAMQAGKGRGSPLYQSPADVEASLSIVARSLPIPTHAYLRSIALRYNLTDAEAGERCMEHGLGDWEGEQIFWMAVLVLLNSRNASEISPGPDLRAINKKRLRSGKHELLSYSICKISPRMLKRAAISETAAQSSVRAHFVRGHFKIRSSGVFWWSPFIRGDAGLGFADKDYIVS